MLLRQQNHPINHKLSPHPSLKISKRHEYDGLVSEILWMEGYWVRTSVKVELTKDEKRKIGRPSAPRWELDIVAYSGRDNVLRVVELVLGNRTGC